MARATWNISAIGNVGTLGSQRFDQQFRRGHRCDDCLEYSPCSGADDRLGAISVHGRVLEVVDKDHGIEHRAVRTA